MNIAVATARLKDQPRSPYISVLPWSSSEAENRHFTWLSTGFLVLTLLLAMLVKWQELPEPPRAEKEKLPPQLTRLIKPVEVEPPKPVEAPKPAPLPEPLKPEPIKKNVPKVINPEQVQKPAEAVKVTEPTQAELTEQAKIKARQSGLLALQDELASMRTNPSLSNLANTDSIQGAGSSDETQRKFVGKKVAASSGGVDTSQLTTDTGSKGELAGRKNTEYVAPTEGLASLAAQQNATEDQVIGSRSTESIRQVLDANKGGIYAIYRRALRNDASLQGKLTVNIQIEPDGSVTAIKLVFSELASPELEKDLLERIRLINFGQQNVTQTLLDYSFNFLPF